MCITFVRACFLYYPKFNMPKYAVAVGRCPGIYDTYDECKLQVMNFSNPKFKKFDSVEEAQSFILKWGKPSSSTSKILEANVKDVNKNSSELLQTPNVISNNEDIHGIFHKVNQLEEKLNKYFSSVTSSLKNIEMRLSKMENECLDRTIGQQPAKRLKLNELDCDTDPTSFLRNDNGIVQVYTDGACTNNGKAGAKAGIGVWFNHSHPLNVSAPLSGPATNNNAEIQAARVAINQAVKAKLNKLCVHTDSQFLINCITEWIKKWKKNDWKVKNGEEVKNKVELVKLDNALQELESVEWIYVKGHKGIEGNEMADKLACRGATLYKNNNIF